MSKDNVIDSLGRIDDDMIRGVEALRRKRKRSRLVHWAAIAACLCLVVAIAIPGVMHQFSESPHDLIEPGASSTGPAGLTVNGVKFLISSHISVSKELPAGFTYAGKADVGGYEGCSYYTNPDIPEWVYVLQEITTDGAVDQTGTLNGIEPHHAYVRYVDIRLRGRDLVCCNGAYYISMWSVYPGGEFADVSLEYYNSMESTYGIRIEGKAFEGFESVGIAEFTGFDTIPYGALASNHPDCKVYVNPDNPDVILVPTQWYTAPVGENGKTNHSGFNVYIRYDCPFAK